MEKCVNDLGTFKESFYFTPCWDFSKPLHLGRQPKTSWVSLPQGQHHS